LSRSVFTALFLVPLVAVLQIPVFLAGVALGTYFVYAPRLPKIPQLAEYQPRTVSTFYADDGTVIGVFYKQKRFVVDLEQIPEHAVKAFLGAEDSRFFQHGGIDWQGVARAAFANLKAGRIVQGGSTITMQVARNFFLTRERSFSRKIKEILLASELERLWGKKKILYIYLNEIYLGEGCYGVEAAARGYFGKPVEHLTLAEAALIAGLVASPARYNPFKNEKLARQRQLTVLRRMLNAELVTQEEHDKAKQETVVFRKDTIRPFDLVPDFAEAVRQYIVRKYGEEKLLNEGLKVFTTCRVDFQQQALDAMTRGLNEIKARQKHPAIVRTVQIDQIPEILKSRKTPKLEQDKLYQGVVVKAVRGKQDTELQVALSTKLTGRVRISNAEAAGYKVGHVLSIRFDKFVDETAHFQLDKDPKLQGALVCVENKTGYVRALVGGASVEHFQFNRATQAKRQPGSSFKPIIYAAAIEKKSYTPATVIVDEPIVVELGNRDDDEWEPKNAGGDYLGPVSTRTALELSRNVCTIKVLMDVGLDSVLSLARKLGIASPLGRNLSLSLGTSEVSLFEIVSAYTVFPNGGVYVEPVLVKRIEDRFGNVLEDNTKLPVLDPSEMPKPTPREEFRELIGDAPLDDDGRLVKPKIPQTARSGPAKGAPKGRDDSPESSDGRVRPVLSPQTAYIMTSMLQGGLVRGTGAGIRSILQRKDLAGKTGTTNNAEDVWFIGFNPDYTAGVWVGFDEKRPIGRREAGGRAALPIWGYFMKAVLEKVPEREFSVPPDVVFEEMTTYVGNTKQGFAPGTVTEPVYAPMVGLTLVMSPIDTPEMLQEYGPSVVSGTYPATGVQQYQPAPYGGGYGPPVTPIYPQGPYPYTPSYDQYRHPPVPQTQANPKQQHSPVQYGGGGMKQGQTPMPPAPGGYPSQQPGQQSESGHQPHGAPQLPDLGYDQRMTPYYPRGHSN
jgi:penicillin-binding protein 1A